MTRKELLLSDFIAFLIGKDFVGKALKTMNFWRAFLQVPAMR